MRIKESAENYLETILMLKNKNGHVRSIDVATEMKFTKASVSVAMKHFREEQLVTVGADGDITLTQKGLEIAMKVAERHNTIAKMLIKLGVNEKTAYIDAGKLEHDISDETFEKMKQFIENEEQ